MQKKTAKQKTDEQMSQYKKKRAEKDKDKSSELEGAAALTLLFAALFKMLQTTVRKKIQENLKRQELTEQNTREQLQQSMQNNQKFMAEMQENRTVLDDNIRAAREQLEAIDQHRPLTAEDDAQYQEAEAQIARDEALRSELDEKIQAQQKSQEEMMEAMAELAPKEAEKAEKTEEPSVDERVQARADEIRTNPDGEETLEHEAEEDNVTDEAKDPEAAREDDVANEDEEEERAEAETLPEMEEVSGMGEFSEEESRVEPEEAQSQRSGVRSGDEAREEVEMAREQAHGGEADDGHGHGMTPEPGAGAGTGKAEEGVANETAEKAAEEGIKHGFGAG